MALGGYCTLTASMFYMAGPRMLALLTCRAAGPRLSCGRPACIVIFATVLCD
jgi:hypothetical protein